MHVLHSCHREGPRVCITVGSNEFTVLVTTCGDHYQTFKRLQVTTLKSTEKLQSWVHHCQGASPTWAYEWWEPKSTQRAVRLPAGSPESLAPPCSICSATTWPLRRQHFLAIGVKMPKVIIFAANSKSAAGGSSSHLNSYRMRRWSHSSFPHTFVALPHRALEARPPAASSSITQHLPVNISLSTKVGEKHLRPRSTTPRGSLWPTRELLMSRQCWHNPPILGHIPS